MSLEEFLLARIAEDEEIAKEAADASTYEGGDARWCPDWLYWSIRHLVRNVDVECPTHPDDCGTPARYAGHHIARHDPARVLADCEAKRRIVEEMSYDGLGPREWTLKVLALPYAGHADYREEWRP